MNFEFLGVGAQEWIWALGVLVVTFVAVNLLVRIIALYARKIASRTQTDLDDLIAELVGKTGTLFVLLISIWAGSRSLDLPEGVARGFTRILTVGVWVQGGIWVTGLVHYFIERFGRSDADPSVTSALGAVRVVATMAIWIIVFLTVLATFDVNVSALVAGLGVGGIAIALAVQSILSDLFGAVTILLDKPFQVGDYIVVGESEGTVEHIGLKTTRITALTGEQLVVGNSDLLSSRIHNKKRMTERRASFQLNVEHGTPYETVQRIPSILEEIVRSHEGVRFDRAHFKTYGPSALIFQIVYWVVVPSHVTYMDAQQSINLAIYKRFEDEGIRFAYPSQTVYVRPDGTEAQLGA